MRPEGTNLVLLRHGESEWNKQNRFTGWHDVALSGAGEAEAARAGQLLAAGGIRPTVLHTSLLTRAIRTAEIALETMGLSWLPVRRSWRLNERHYGGLTGLNKAEMAEQHGDEQVLVWRRSYDVRPPELDPTSRFNMASDPRYANLGADAVPSTECLADVVDRLMPYFDDAITADLKAGEVVLVVAHGNSLRALIKHLDGIADDAIVGLNLPTGVPICYQLDDRFMPTQQMDVSERYLG